MSSSGRASRWVMGAANPRLPERSTSCSTRRQKRSAVKGVTEWVSMYTIANSGAVKPTFAATVGSAT